MKGLDEKQQGNLFGHLTQFSASDVETILQYFFFIKQGGENSSAL